MSVVQLCRRLWDTVSDCAVLSNSPCIKWKKKPNKQKKTPEFSWAKVLSSPIRLTQQRWLMLGSVTNATQEVASNDLASVFCPFAFLPQFQQPHNKDSLTKAKFFSFFCEAIWICCSSICCRNLDCSGHWQHTISCFWRERNSGTWPFWQVVKNCCVKKKQQNNGWTG